MKQFKCKYWYLATGMEGIADEYPEDIIEASDREEANFKYLSKYNTNFSVMSFEDFMQLPDHHRWWASHVEELKDTQPYH